MRAYQTGIPNLLPAQLDLLGTSVPAANPANDKGIASVRPYYRDGGLQHLQVLQGGGTDGLWIPDRAARELDAKVGDTILIGAGNRPTRATIATIYRDPASLPLTAFWCGQQSLIYPLSAFSNFLPPPLFTGSRRYVETLEHALDDRGALATWDFQVHQQGLTVEDASALAGTFQALEPRIVASQPIQYQFAMRVDSNLPFLANLATSTKASLAGAIGTVSLAGRLVALVVIGAAGLSWVTRRRSEVILLAARGASPASLGVKALLESLPIAVVGAVLGWFVADRLVRRLGPTSLLDTGAPGSALRQAVWTAAASLVLLALVAGLAARREAEITVSRARQVAARIPWEIPVLLLAAASLYEIWTRKPPQVTDVRIPPTVDVLVLLFPLLFVAGAAGIVVRLLQRLLPRLRAAGTRWPTAGYLASRRLAGASQTAMTLLTVTALAVGILAYAGTLSSSQAATANAKAQVFIGSDVAANLVTDPNITGLPFPATRILRLQDGSLVGGGAEAEQVDLIGVDPGTFPGAAFWDSSFASSSLPSLLAKLGRASGGQLPVLVVGSDLPDNGVLRFAQEQSITFRSVGRTSAFPGMKGGNLLMVARRDALLALDPHGIDQVWAKGPSATIVRTLLDRHAIVAGSEAIADETQQLPQFVALRWTLGYLQALGVMTALIALGGIVLYLQSRQRAREVAYALARRMGLKRAEHRRSVVLELVAMLVLGVLIGAFLAWAAARLVYGKLDPMPILPPAPLFRSPLGLLGITAGVALIAAWIGAWRVQRTAEHADVTEVMRLAA
jgi:putative ABC transport system permease protein